MNTLIAFPSGGLHGVRDMVPGNEREVGAFYYFLFFFLIVLDYNRSYNVLQL